MIDLEKMQKLMQPQTDEFDAVAELVKAYNNLPAIVDDDYPHMRSRYEGAMQKLLQALGANGRVLPSVSEPTTNPDDITDAQRIDWLERQVKRSPTGISFDWIPSVESQPSGFRFMRRHMIGDAKKTLRGCVDYLIKQGRDNS